MKKESITDDEATEILDKEEEGAAALAPICQVCRNRLDDNPWTRRCPGHGICHIACMVACSREPGCGEWFCPRHERAHFCLGNVAPAPKRRLRGKPSTSF